MTDTPRTDNQINGNGKLKLGGDPLKYARVDSEFARQLERENNDAKQHIRELIFAGNALREWCEVLYDRNSTTTEQARLIKRDIQQWSQATQ